MYVTIKIEDTGEQFEILQSEYQTAIMEGRTGFNVKKDGTIEMIYPEEVKENNRKTTLEKMLRVKELSKNYMKNQARRR